jgi:hypothetical protein
MFQRPGLAAVVFAQPPSEVVGRSDVETPVPHTLRNIDKMGHLVGPTTLSRPRLRRGRRAHLPRYRRGSTTLAPLRSNRRRKASPRAKIPGATEPHSSKGAEWVLKKSGKNGSVLICFQAPGG